MSTKPLTMKITFAAPPSARSKSTTERRSASEWEVHKEFIRKRYVDRGDTPKDVLEALSDRGFTVSLPQLRHKVKEWDFKQKTMLSQEERIFIAQELSDRTNKGKKSSIRKDGVKLDKRNVRRTVRRHGKEDAISTSSATGVSVSTIAVYTPSSCSSMAPTPRYYSPQPSTPRTPRTPHVPNTPRFQSDLETTMDVINEDPHLLPDPELELLLVNGNNFPSEVDYSEDFNYTPAVFPPKTFGLEEELENLSRDINEFLAPEDRQDTVGVSYHPDDPEKAGQNSSLSASQAYRSGLDTSEDVSLFYMACDFTNTFRQQRQFDKTISWLKEALVAKLRLLFKLLRAAQRDLGKSHPRTLCIIHCIGTTQTSLGFYGDALGWFKEAFIKRRNALGILSEPTLKSLFYLGSVYRYQYRYAYAMVCFRHFHRIHRQVLKEEHELSLEIFTAIGSTLLEQKYFDEAWGWLEQGLAAQQKVLAEGHWMIFCIKCWIGKYLWYRSEFAKALDWCNGLLSDNMRRFGEEHPEILFANNEKLATLTELGCYEEAISLADKQISIGTKVYGEESRRTAISKYWKVVALEGLGRYVEARDLCLQVIAAWKKLLPEDHEYILLREKDLERLNTLIARPC